MKPASRTTWRFGAGGHGGAEGGTGGAGGGIDGAGGGTGGAGAGGGFRLPPSERAHLMPATAVTEREDAFAVSMLVATAIAQAGRPVLVCEPRTGRRRAAGLFSTALARGMAEIVAARFDDLAPVSRGSVCHLALPDDPDEISGRLDRLVAALPVSAVCLVSLSADLFRRLLEEGPTEVDSAVILAELPRDRAVTALVCGELGERGIRCRVWRPVLRAPRKQLALAGLPPGGTVGVTARRLILGLGLGPER